MDLGVAIVLLIVLLVVTVYMLIVHRFLSGDEKSRKQPPVSEHPGERHTTEQTANDKRKGYQDKDSSEGLTP